MLSIDIDFFKRINDTWGYPAGDSVLRELAAVVSSGIRGEDLFAGMGGEKWDWYPCQDAVGGRCDPVTVVRPGSRAFARLPAARQSRSADRFAHRLRARPQS
jgi:hypothetical protein